MSAYITITDDGDEVVYIAVVNEGGAVKVIEADHGRYGWDGMTGVIEAVKAVARALDVEVVDTQDIV